MSNKILDTTKYATKATPVGADLVVGGDSANQVGGVDALTNFSFTSINTFITQPAGVFLVKSGGANTFQVQRSDTTQMVNVDNAGNVSIATSIALPAISPDTSIYRLAAAVAGMGTGGPSGKGWVQNSAGEGALASNYTNATAGMTNTNLSFTLLAGRLYRIYGVLQISNSTAGEGAQFDFNGGGATATTFFMSASLIGTATAVAVTSTTLAGVINWSSVTGTDYVVFQGFLKVNAAGTFILRAAENTHSTGTLTVGAGSWLALADTVGL